MVARSTSAGRGEMNQTGSAAPPDRSSTAEQHPATKKRPSADGGGGAASTAEPRPQGEARSPPQRRRSSLGGGASFRGERGIDEGEEEGGGGHGVEQPHLRLDQGDGGSGGGGGSGGDGHGGCGDGDDDASPREGGHDDGLGEDAAADEEEVEEVADALPQRVDDGLFIGAWPAERDLAALERRGITHVLQAADGVYPSHPLALSYLVLPVADSPEEDLVARFGEAFAFMDAARRQRQRQQQREQQQRGGGDGDGDGGDNAQKQQQHQQASAARALGGGGVLVMCAAGVSRSASLVVADLMRRRGWSYDRALGVLRDVRPFVAPNPGFEAQLRRYEALGFDHRRWRGWAVERGGAAASAE